MKNKELFEKTVSILADAYRNNTLRHGDYCGCAVGNIIASNMGYNITEKDNGNFTWGLEEFDGLWYDKKLNNNFRKNNELLEKQIISTGYTFGQLMIIEKAFEDTRRSSTQLNGLYAVYNVLCTLHEVDINEVISAELVFIKA